MYQFVMLWAEKIEQATTNQAKDNLKHSAIKRHIRKVSHF